jgi:hypothetical protein
MGKGCLETQIRPGQSTFWTWAPLFAIGIAAMSIYLASSAPSLVWAHWGSDGGNLVTAAVTGRVSHPPGAPTYHLLARASILLFRGDPARILNVLSATMAAGAALLLAATLRWRGLGWIISGSVALALAFAPWLWSQAVITEVYTTGVFFATLAVFFSEARFRRRRQADFLSGLALGLAVSVHVTVGAVGVYLLLSRRRKWLWRAAVPGFLLGLVPYLLLPCFGPWPQPWGDLRSLGGWWEFVSARMYWGNAFALQIASWPRRSLAWLVFLSRQFTPPGLLLVLIGLGSLWNRERRHALAVVAAWLPVTLYAVGYNSADSWVYLLAYLPLLALLLAEGLRWITARGMPSWLALGLPLALVLLNWVSLDLSADREVAIWLDQTLDRLPRHALVLTNADRHTFALWYATDVLGMREDLVVVDERLWGYGPYVGFIGARIGVDRLEFEDLVRERSVCHISQEGEVICPE